MASPCPKETLHNEFLGAIFAFIQPSTHKDATGTFGDERLMYTTLATHRRSGTGPERFFGKAENIVHKCVRSNECPCPDKSPPVCKIIFVNVGILHKIRSKSAIQGSQRTEPKPLKEHKKLLTFAKREAYPNPMFVAIHSRQPLR